MPQRIEVVAYSGYRGEESPRTFILNGETIEVVEVLHMWIEESLENRERRRCFKVKGSDGYTHKLYFDEMAKEWIYS